MIMEKKTRIIIVIVAAILLGIAVIAAISKDKRENKKPPGTTSGTTVISAGYDISGVWYSDQPGGDTLTLNQDNRYTSSSWLAAGTFTIENSNIILTDSFGTSKTLIVKTNNNGYILVFDNSNSSHSYFRTEQEANLSSEAKKQHQQQIEDDVQKDNFDAVQQLLMMGEWISITGETTLVFTEQTYTVAWNSAVFNEKELTETIKYEITEATLKNGTYSIKWIMTKSDGLSFNITDITLVIKDGGLRYTLYSDSFPFERAFEKTFMP